MKRTKANGDTVKTKKKMKGGVIVVLIIVVLLVGSLIYAVQNADRLGAAPADQQEEQTGVPVFFEVEQFSRISEEQLVELLGEPTETEDWTNKVNDISGYKMTTYRYVDGDVCYEYNFTTNNAGEKPLVYMIMLFNYNGEGSTLEVGLNEDVFARIGVTPNRTVKIEADTGIAMRWSGVSDKVYEVWAQCVANDENMVDWVKIKFDPKFPL